MNAVTRAQKAVQANAAEIIQLPAELVAGVAVRCPRLASLQEVVVSTVNEYIQQSHLSPGEVRQAAIDVSRQLQAASRTQAHGGLPAKPALSREALRPTVQERRDAAAAVETEGIHAVDAAAFNRYLGLPLPVALQEQLEQVGKPKHVPAHQDARYALGYALARLAGHHAALASILRNVSVSVPKLRPHEMLDYHAGPGAASWAAQEVWPGLRAITAVEASVKMSQLGVQVANAIRQEASVSRLPRPPQMVWMRTLPLLAKKGSRMRRKYDVVVASYALTSAGSLVEQKRLVRELWDRTSDVLVLVEPGTPLGFNAIREARDMVLTEQNRRRSEALGIVDGVTMGSGDVDNNTAVKLQGLGAHVLAPCGHDGRCPMQGGRMWCHFGQRFEPPGYVQRAWGTQRSVQEEKFSYVVLRRGPRPCLEGADDVEVQVAPQWVGGVPLARRRRLGDAADTVPDVPPVYLPPRVVRQQIMLDRFAASAASSTTNFDEGQARIATSDDAGGTGRTDGGSPITLSRAAAASSFADVWPKVVSSTSSSTSRQGGSSTHSPSSAQDSARSSPTRPGRHDSHSVAQVPRLAAASPSASTSLLADASRSAPATALAAGPRGRDGGNAVDASPPAVLPPQPALDDHASARASMRKLLEAVAAALQQRSPPPPPPAPTPPVVPPPHCSSPVSPAAEAAPAAPAAATCAPSRAMVPAGGGAPQAAAPAAPAAPAAATNAPSQAMVPAGGEAPQAAAPAAGAAASTTSAAPAASPAAAARAAAPAPPATDPPPAVSTDAPAPPAPAPAPAAPAARAASEAPPAAAPSNTPHRSANAKPSDGLATSPSRSHPIASAPPPPTNATEELWPTHPDISAHAGTTAAAAAAAAVHMSQATAGHSVSSQRGAALGAAAFDRKFPAFGRGFIDRLVALDQAGVQWAAGGTAATAAAAATAITSGSGASASIANPPPREQGGAMEEASALPLDAQLPPAPAGWRSTAFLTSHEAAEEEEEEADAMEDEEFLGDLQPLNWNLQNVDGDERRRAEAYLYRTVFGVERSVVVTARPSKQQAAPATAAAASSATAAISSATAGRGVLDAASDAAVDAALVARYRDEEAGRDWDEEQQQEEGTEEVEEGGVAGELPVTATSGNWVNPRLQRLTELSSFRWPRIYRPPRVRGGHAILDLCVPTPTTDASGAVVEAGQLERHVISRSDAKGWMGPPAYQMARRVAWGDLWPTPYTLTRKKVLVRGARASAPDGDQDAADAAVGR